MKGHVHSFRRRGGGGGGLRLLAATPWPSLPLPGPLQSTALSCPNRLPFPAPIDCPFPSAEFQKETEPEGKKKGKFKTMKVLKLLGNKRDTKSKCPGDRS